MRKTAAILPLILLAHPARAADTRPVTQDQFKELVRIFKSVVDRFDRVEGRMRQLEAGGGASAAGGSTKAAGGDTAAEAVDLNAMGGENAPNSGNPHHSSGPAPMFKVFFDLNLINRPGVSDLTFDNIHSFFMVEMAPSPDVQFSFDVSASPRYYELDYQITPKLQFRAGKIWIPFDDMAPHNIFGGRVNVSKLSQGTSAFLPDLWTDMGVGLKYQLVDTPKLSLETHLYVVNGFRSGGSDPLNVSLGPEGYPTFSDLPNATDNNRNKSVGGRVHAKLFSGKLGFGVSYYTGRWNSQTQDVAKTLSILGLDAQVRFGRTELRVGNAVKSVNAAVRSFTGGGAYGEIGQKLGRNQNWKILGRAGAVQLDDKVFSQSDTTMVGGTLLWKPGLIEYSIEHSRDFNVTTTKRNRSYTAARIIVAL